MTVTALLRCLWNPAVDDFCTARKDIEAQVDKDCDAIVAGMNIA